MNVSRMGLFCAAVVSALVLSAPGTSRAEMPSYMRLADAHMCIGTEPCVVKAGEVLQVFYWQYSELGSEPSHGVVLKMRGPEGEFLAYMGPQRYHERVGNVFAPGDRLEISGALAAVNGAEMLVGKNFLHAGDLTGIRDDAGKLLSLK